MRITRSPLGRGPASTAGNSEHLRRNNHSSLTRFSGAVETLRGNGQRDWEVFRGGPAIPADFWEVYAGTSMSDQQMPAAAPIGSPQNNSEMPVRESRYPTNACDVPVARFRCRIGVRRPRARPITNSSPGAPQLALGRNGQRRVGVCPHEFFFR